MKVVKKKFWYPLFDDILYLIEYFNFILASNPRRKLFRSVIGEKARKSGGNIRQK